MVPAIESMEWQDLAHGAHSRAFFGLPRVSPGGWPGRALRTPAERSRSSRTGSKRLTAGKNGSVIIAISTPLARLIRGNGLLKNAAKQLSFTDLGRVTGSGIGRLRFKHHVQTT